MSAAVRPRDRTHDEGFDVGFEDLPEGRLTEPNPAYFRYLDGYATFLDRYKAGLAIERAAAAIEFSDRRSRAKSGGRLRVHRSTPSRRSAQRHGARDGRR
jgi:hypothetical protein